MNWKEMVEKYPKAFRAFQYWGDRLGEPDGYDCINFTWGEDYSNYGVRWRVFYELPFEMQIGALEKFFDERGIIVTSNWQFDVNDNSKIIWEGMAWLPKQPDRTELENTGFYGTRSEAQIAAFELAFSTLESKLP